MKRERPMLCRLRIKETTYRGEEGFSVRGKVSTWLLPANIFVKTRTAAEAVREAIKAGEDVTLGMMMLPDVLGASRPYIPTADAIRTIEEAGTDHEVDAMDAGLRQAFREARKVEGVSLKSFADIIGAELEVKYRDQTGHLKGLPPFYANLKGAEIKGRGTLRSAFGDGPTPEAAVLAYLPLISGQTLVFDAMKASRREYNVPLLTSHGYDFSVQSAKPVHRIIDGGDPWARIQERLDELVRVNERYEGALREISTWSGPLAGSRGYKARASEALGEALGED